MGLRMAVWAKEWSRTLPRDKLKARAVASRWGRPKVAHLACCQLVEHAVHTSCSWNNGYIGFVDDMVVSLDQRGNYVDNATPDLRRRID